MNVFHNPKYFFNVTKSRIASLKITFILWFYIYTIKSNFTTLTFPLPSYTRGFGSDLLFLLSSDAK